MRMRCTKSPFNRVVLISRLHQADCVRVCSRVFWSLYLERIYPSYHSMASHDADQLAASSQADIPGLSPASSSGSTPELLDLVCHLVRKEIRTALAGVAESSSSPVLPSLPALSGIPEASSLTCSKLAQQRKPLLTI